MKTFTCLMSLVFLFNSHVFASSNGKRPAIYKSQVPTLNCLIGRNGEDTPNQDYKKNFKLLFFPNKAGPTHNWISRDKRQKWSLQIKNNGNVVLRVEESVGPSAVFTKIFDFSIQNFSNKNIIGFDTQEMEAHAFNNKTVKVRLACQ